MKTFLQKIIKKKTQKATESVSSKHKKVLFCKKIKEKNW